jgi:hypothetical protein
MKVKAGVLLCLLLAACQGQTRVSLPQVSKQMDCFTQREVVPITFLVCEQDDGSTVDCQVSFDFTNKAVCYDRDDIREVDGYFRKFSAACYRRGADEARCTEGDTEGWCEPGYAEFGGDRETSLECTDALSTE